MIQHFTSIFALVGGGFIGPTAAVLLLFNGRMASVSGIVGDLLQSPTNDFGWRLAYVFGPVAGPVMFQLVAGQVAPVTIDAGFPLLISC